MGREAAPAAADPRGRKEKVEMCERKRAIEEMRSSGRPHRIQDRWTTEPDRFSSYMYLALCSD